MRLLLALLVILDLAGTGTVTIKIPPGIPLEEREVRAVLPERFTMGRHDAIEIVVYYFSLGVVKLSYGDGDEMNESAMEGNIRALVKLKKKGALASALFISASGVDKAEILKNFSRTLGDTIAKQ